MQRDRGRHRQQVSVTGFGWCAGAIAGAVLLEAVGQRTDGVANGVVIRCGVGAPHAPDLAGAGLERGGPCVVDKLFAGNVDAATDVQRLFQRHHATAGVRQGDVVVDWRCNVYRQRRKRTIHKRVVGDRARGAGTTGVDGQILVTAQVAVKNHVTAMGGKGAGTTVQVHVAGVRGAVVCATEG